ncbi:acyltransferase [Vibrio chagasii]|uniref:acyltransferase family protein n=1 Tax=Vibrio chagasii TaxID=170679 RepID=UPI003DA8C1A0
MTSFTRNEIDTIRGLACFIVVIYHSIHGTLGSVNWGGDIYHQINVYLSYIRMPLFVFLSGYVYSFRPFEHDHYKFISGKFKRLIIPMLTVGTLYAVVREIAPGTNNSLDKWWLLHIKPVSYFWFVEAIFVIFMIVMVFQTLGFLLNRKRMEALIVLSIFVSSIGIPIEYFSIDNASYVFPFFMFGLYCGKYKLRFKKMVSSFLLLMLFGCFSLDYFNIINMPERKSVIGIVIGMLIPVYILSLSVTNNTLSKIGLYSYTIYLFHTFFVSGARVFFSKIGYFDINVLIITGTLSGIFIPILIEELSKPFISFRKYFLGKRV